MSATFSGPGGAPEYERRRRGDVLLRSVDRVLLLDAAGPDSRFTKDGLVDVLDAA
jgi:hypothetical protein